MFNTRDLRGSLVRASWRGSSMGGLEHAIGGRGPGGPLGPILVQPGGDASAP
jgi:hypothetical protein